MVECWRCGGDDHHPHDCPWGFDPYGGGKPDRYPQRADDRPPGVPPRKPPEEIADPIAFADAIRSDMGWERGDRRHPWRGDLMALARSQVAESRGPGVASPSQPPDSEDVDW